MCSPRLVRPRRSTGLFLALAGGLALPRLAAACATCYGAAGSPMVDGQNKAILFLLGVVGLIYLGVGKVIWELRQRARRLPPPAHCAAAPAPPVRHLRLIHGGKH